MLIFFMIMLTLESLLNSQKDYIPSFGNFYCSFACACAHKFACATRVAGKFSTFSFISHSQILCALFKQITIKNKWKNSNFLTYFKYSFETVRDRMYEKNFKMKRDVELLAAKCYEQEHKGYCPSIFLVTLSPTKYESGSINVKATTAFFY